MVAPTPSSTAAARQGVVTSPEGCCAPPGTGFVVLPGRPLRALAKLLAWPALVFGCGFAACGFIYWVVL